MPAVNQSLSDVGAAFAKPLHLRPMKPPVAYMHREQLRLHPNAPGPRMMRVLARLSRERWIPPGQIRVLAIRLAWKFGSGQPQKTAKGFLPVMAPFVGMLRGDAVCDENNSCRALLIQRLKKIEQRRDALALGELEILHFVLKKGAYKWM